MCARYRQDKPELFKVFINRIRRKSLFLQVLKGKFAPIDFILDIEVLARKPLFQIVDDESISPYVRRKALSALDLKGKKATARELAILEKVLLKAAANPCHEKDASWLKVRIASLLACSGPKGHDILKRFFSNADEEVRSIIILNVDPCPEDLILAASNDPSKRVRSSAVDRYSCYQKETFLDVLLKGMEDPSGDVQLTAVCTAHRIMKTDRRNKAVQVFKRIIEDRYLEDVGHYTSIAAECLLIMAEWQIDIPYLIEKLGRMFEGAPQYPYAVWRAAEAIAALKKCAPEAAHLAPQLAYHWYYIDKANGPITIYGGRKFSDACLWAFEEMGKAGIAALEACRDDAKYGEAAAAALQHILKK